MKQLSTKQIEFKPQISDNQQEMLPDMHYNQPFHELILSISTDFIQLGNKDIETGIVQALQKIADFLQIERGFVTLLNPITQQLQVNYEWQQNGMKSACPRLEEIPFDWESAYRQALVKNKILCFPDVSKMSRDWYILKKQLQDCRIVGFLSIAIFLQNKFAGFVGFVTSKSDCVLPTGSKNSLAIVGTMLGNLMLRKQTYDQLNTFTQNLRALHRLKMTDYEKFENQFADYLQTGREIFGMDTGVVSRITEDIYKVEAIVSNWLGIKAGMEFPCSWMYCSKVIEEQKTIYYDHVGTHPEMQHHPGYKRLPIESFIGAPIFVNNELYGTINFTKKAPRNHFFVEQDKEIIEIMAQGIGKLIETKIIEIERSEALQELQNSKTRYQAILENQTELICRFLPEGKPTFFNQTFLDYLTQQQINLVEFNFLDFISKDSHEFVTLLQALSPKHPFMSHIHQWTLENRATKWERWNCRAIYNTQNQLIEYQAVGQDITDRKTAEIKLEKTNQYLEEIASNLKRSNEDLRQFAYAASHDLQEPIRMISSYLQLIERRYKKQLDAEGIEFINYAVSGAKRMQTLINDLLAYSRVNTRQKNMSITNLNSIVDVVLHTLKGKIQEAGAKIQIANLPQVKVDTSQFIRLFQNLLENALKFTKEGEAPMIEVLVEKKDNHWQFEIKDNGIGIEANFFDKVFIIFQRLHTRNEYPGTGIGLAVCKKIVERHHGTIWIESTIEEGTSFFFTLPK